jgi:hypothetical protein
MVMLSVAAARGESRISAKEREFTRMVKAH